MKTMIKRTIVAVAAICGLLVWVAPAAADLWNPTSGEATHFFYANGCDVNGLFGNPYVDTENDTFHFVDSVFQVHAVNGQVISQDDTFSVDLTAKTGWRFSWMTIEAFGSYALSGPQSCADFTGQLSMHELAGGFRTWSGDMVTNPIFSFCGPSSGEWTGTAMVDVSAVWPEPQDQVHVAFSNMLEVSAPEGGSAELNVQYTYLNVTFGMIPEPASLALLAFGGLMLARRRH
jgi:hypothetical protein